MQLNTCAMKWEAFDLRYGSFDRGEVVSVTLSKAKLTA
jgi:hypothetical protein